MNPELRALIEQILALIYDTEECECEGPDDKTCVLCVAQRAQELLEKEPRP